MINKEADSGVVATIKQFWDKNKEQRKREMAIATHAFLPKLETFCTDTNLATADQALRQIYNIRYCMKQCDETANVSNLRLTIPILKYINIYARLMNIIIINFYSA